MHLVFVFLCASVYPYLRFVFSVSGLVSLLFLSGSGERCCVASEGFAERAMRTLTESASLKIGSAKGGLCRHDFIKVPSDTKLLRK